MFYLTWSGDGEAEDSTEINDVNSEEDDHELEQDTEGEAQSNGMFY